MILLGGFAVLFIINLASLYLDRSPSHKHMPGLYVLENPLHYGYEYDSLWVYEDGSFKERQKSYQESLVRKSSGIWQWSWDLDFLVYAVFTYESESQASCLHTEILREEMLCLFKKKGENYLFGLSRFGLDGPIEETFIRSEER